jgi:transcriptional regulator with XRE-family HTH domain
VQNAPVIMPAQIRAARGLMDWSRLRLSTESGVPMSTLADYENERTKSMLTMNMGRIISAFERHGVIFIGSLGVTFKKGTGADA